MDQVLLILLNAPEPRLRADGMHYALREGKAHETLAYLPDSFRSDNKEEREAALEIFEELGPKAEPIVTELIKCYVNRDIDSPDRVVRVLETIVGVARPFAFKAFCRNPTERLARLVFRLDVPRNDISSWSQYVGAVPDKHDTKALAAALSATAPEHGNAFEPLMWLAESSEDDHIVEAFLSTAEETSSGGLPAALADRALQTFYVRNPSSDAGVRARELVRNDDPPGPDVSLESFVQTLFSFPELSDDRQRDVLHCIALEPSKWEPVAYSALHHGQDETARQLRSLTDRLGVESLPIISAAVGADLVSAQGGAQAFEVLQLGSEELKDAANKHAHIVGEENSEAYKNGLLQILAADVELLRSQKEADTNTDDQDGHFEEYFGDFEDSLLTIYEEIRAERGLPPDDIL